MSDFKLHSFKIPQIPLKPPAPLRLKRPSRLRLGDTIGIVAPAWAFDRDNFKKGIKRLRDIGFKVKYDRSIFSKYWAMAGYDKERAAQINRMFSDKQIKAILCAKGGYGSIRTIPYLKADIISKNPKIFVGYSDMTILLYYLYTVAKMVVFHGPVVSDEIYKSMNPTTFDYFLRALMQPEAFGELKFNEIKILRPGKASGILVGGNMASVTNAIGTPYDIDMDNKILFLEDIGEDLEIIDAYLMHLKLAGKLKKIKGIIFGRMVDCLDRPDGRYTIKDILHDILSDIRVPIIYGFPSGHRERGSVNVTLPFGVSVTLNADKKKLTINEPAVK
ncbi:MAG: LD-carboxypeptidase [Candidatus Omnitrophica bacterium]|nr:LD-carboxypeptidase [Candidatus Omnitrophota bacterium]